MITRTSTVKGKRLELEDFVNCYAAFVTNPLSRPLTRRQVAGKILMSKYPSFKSVLA